MAQTKKEKAAAKALDAAKDAVAEAKRLAGKADKAARKKASKVEAELAAVAADGRPPVAESLAAGKAKQLEETKPEPSGKREKAAAVTVVTAPTAARAAEVANKVARSSAVKAAKSPQATRAKSSMDSRAKPSAAKGSTKGSAKAGPADLETRSPLHSCGGSHASGVWPATRGSPRPNCSPRSAAEPLGVWPSAHLRSRRVVPRCRLEQEVP